MKLLNFTNKNYSCIFNFLTIFFLLQVNTSTLLFVVTQFQEFFCILFVEEFWIIICWTNTLGWNLKVKIVFLISIIEILKVLKARWIVIFLVVLMIYQILKKVLAFKTFPSLSCKNIYVQIENFTSTIRVSTLDLHVYSITFSDRKNVCQLECYTSLIFLQQNKYSCWNIFQLEFFPTNRKIN